MAKDKDSKLTVPKGVRYTTSLQEARNGTDLREPKNFVAGEEIDMSELAVDRQLVIVGTADASTAETDAAPAT